MKSNYTIENFMRQGPGTAPFPKGINDALGGCYSDEFPERSLLGKKDIDPRQRREQKVLEKTSDEWKKGFADGYAEVIG